VVIKNKEKVFENESLVYTIKRESAVKENPFFYFLLFLPQN